jgi:hypothetical protein
MWGGTAKRSQLQLPVGLVFKYRGSKGRSATVDCCSSDLSVPDGKPGTILREALQCPQFFVRTRTEENHERKRPSPSARFGFECSTGFAPD